MNLIDQYCQPNPVEGLVVLVLFVCLIVWIVRNWRPAPSIDESEDAAYDPDSPEHERDIKEVE